MIPSALSSQLQRGLADFLRFSFWSSTPGMEKVIEDLLAEPGGLLEGPFVSLELPFVTGHDPHYFPDVPLGFTPHLHQELAFERLGGRRKQSTLVATGTGAGKTRALPPARARPLPAQRPATLLERHQAQGRGGWLHRRTTPSSRSSSTIPYLANRAPQRHERPSEARPRSGLTA